MSTPVHVVIDLETMGTLPGCAVVGIGAVVVGADNEIGNTFSEQITLESNVAHGLRLEPDTVRWWLDQSDIARASIIGASASLQSALIRFDDFLNDACEGERHRLRVWGFGSDFDNAVLAAAYRAVGFDIGWPYWANRCLRTLLATHPVARVNPEVPHIALNDAIAQARTLMKVASTYGLRLQVLGV